MSRGEYWLYRLSYRRIVRGRAGRNTWCDRAAIPGSRPSIKCRQRGVILCEVLTAMSAA